MEILGQYWQALDTMHARQSERRRIFSFCTAACHLKNVVSESPRDTPWENIGPSCHRMFSITIIYVVVCINKTNLYIVRCFFSRPDSNTSPAAGTSNDVCGQSRAEGAPRIRSEWHRVAFIFLYVCMSNNDEPPEMSLNHTRGDKKRHMQQHMLFLQLANCVFHMICFHTICMWC